ncbi:hypothetical protein MTO96_032988 [Rhipicephalus appendiculatus]
MGSWHKAAILLAAQVGWWPCGCLGEGAVVMAAGWPTGCAAKRSASRSASSCSLMPKRMATARTGCRAVPITRDRRSRHALELPLAWLRVAESLPALPSATIGMSPSDCIDPVEECAMLWALCL